MLSIASAHAQQNLAFVSINGQDAGGCSSSSPCRTFSYAAGQVQAGGQLIALDASDFQPIEITKSLVVSGPPDGRAVIKVPSGGIAVHIIAPNADVQLNNIEISGVEISTGINVESAKSLLISNLKMSGVRNGLMTSTTNPVSVSVSQSELSGLSGNGLSVALGSLFVSHVKMSDIATSSGAGITISGGSLHVDHCQIVGSYNGIEVDTGNSQQSFAFIQDSLITSSKQFGLIIQPGARISLEQATVTGNPTGIENYDPLSDALLLFGGNYIKGNGSDIKGPSTVIGAALNSHN